MPARSAPQNARHAAVDPGSGRPGGLYRQPREMSVEEWGCRPVSPRSGPARIHDQQDDRRGLCEPAGPAALVAGAVLAVVPLKVTVLLEVCEAPKLEPLMVTAVPTIPDAGVKEVIASVDVAVVLELELADGSYFWGLASITDGTINNPVNNVASFDWTFVGSGALQRAN